MRYFSRLKRYGSEFLTKKVNGRVYGWAQFPVFIAFVQKTEIIIFSYSQDRAFEKKTTVNFRYGPLQK